MSKRGRQIPAGQLSGILLILVVLPAFVSFGAGQTSPVLSGLIMGLVGVPFIVLMAGFVSTSGDTRGCLSVFAAVFGLLTLGCGAGTAASLAFDNWKV